MPSRKEVPNDRKVPPYASPPAGPVWSRPLTASGDRCRQSFTVQHPPWEAEKLASSGGRGAYRLDYKADGVKMNRRLLLYDERQCEEDKVRAISIGYASLVMLIANPLIAALL